MKSCYLLIFFLCTFCLNSYGQISDIVFIGSVELSGSKRGYSYKLQVTDSNGVLSGYSVTDLRGANETKTEVKGTLNATKKLVTFRETKILYTKSEVPAADFCYINGSLKIGKLKGTVTLRGSFKGVKADGKTLCAKGKITLICAKDILNKLMKIAEADSIAKAKEKVDTVKKMNRRVEVVYEKEVPESQIQKLTAGKTIELICPQPVVVMEIWDSKTIDGDRIMLLQDNVPILDNFTISGNRKTLRIDMGKSKSVNLRLKALNEGSEPMNTARMKVTCGSEIYYIDASTVPGKDVFVVLKIKE